MYRGHRHTCATIAYRQVLPIVDTSELDLYRLFAPHGALLSCRVHADERTRLCRGVAFVNFKREEEALAALAALHGMRLERGYKLHITVQVGATTAHLLACGWCQWIYW
jgi:hypothetical protein